MMPRDYDVLSIDGRTLLVTENGRILSVPSGGSGDAGDGRDETTTEAAEAAEVAATTTEGADAGDGATRDAADMGEKKPVPYERFRERNERAKRYEQFGDPDEVSWKIQRLTEFERAEAEQAERRRLAQESAAGDGLSTEERQALRVMERLLDKLPPAAAARFLEKLGPGTAQRLLRMPDNERLQVEDYNAAGFREMREALTGYEGVKTDDETLGRFENLVETEILRDPRLKGGYWNPAERARVIGEAVGRVITHQINPILLAQGARAIERATARRATTLARPTHSGTSPAKPAEFKSKHAAGSIGHERDKRLFRSQEIDAILNQPGEDA